MNEMLETIRQRRSVRSYRQEAVPRELIETVIAAGNHAPSAMNSQPWRFVVVEETGFRKKLLAAALPGARTFFESIRNADPESYEAIRRRLEETEDPIYYSAPAIIFVIGNGRYADHSCPLACQNIMLAAHSLGLGTCWVGLGAMITGDPEIAKALELKEDEKIFGPILLGYPAQIPNAPAKKGAVIRWI
jgi:nitroreductase